MRKLLLLLPLMALASCSGGHDLMSDKTFRLKCKAPMPGVNSVMTISPALPQVTLVASNGEKTIEELWDLAKVSPTSLVIQDPADNEIKFVIDRRTGKVIYEVPSTYTEIPPKSELECDPPQSL